MRIANKLGYESLLSKQYSSDVSAAAQHFWMNETADEFSRIAMTCLEIDETVDMKGRTFMNKINGTTRKLLCAAAPSFGFACLLLFAGCPDARNIVQEWPIAKRVYTTAEQQILPIGLPPDTPEINPADVPLYAQFGYSAWHVGPGTDYSEDADNPQPYDKRSELAPGYTDAPNAAHLLSFFAITDIHLTDKESPAQVIYT